MRVGNVSAALLALASASSFAAGPGQLGPVNNVPTVIGNVVAPGIFSDVYAFTLNAPATLSGGVNDIEVPPQLAISNTFFAVSLFNTTTSTPYGVDSTPSNFSFAGLSAGAYTLTVFGQATGTTGGMYSGGFLAAVPEPETYALMVAGLGAVGFIARRRRTPA
jgi:hypothetical protein